MKKYLPTKLNCYFIKHMCWAYKRMKELHGNHGGEVDIVIRQAEDFYEGDGYVVARRDDDRFTGAIITNSLDKRTTDAP